MREYDIIAIGGGSGGSATMNRAAMYGAKAAVIEGNIIGGTCVNVGCVPKKVMWYGAQVSETLKNYSADYGYTIGETSFDFKTLRKNREAYIERSRQAFSNNFNRNGVDYIEGYARFVDKNTVEVNGEHIRAKHIVIATGSYAFIPNVPGSELGGTSDDVFAWEELPESVSIIGAGYIAVELAGVLHALGVKTDLFVRKGGPLRGFDQGIVEVLVEEMKKNGQPLHTHKVPQKLEKLDNGDIQIHFEDGTTHTSQKVIWAVGRKANVHQLNLEAAGVELTERGFIQVDE